LTEAKVFGVRYGIDEEKSNYDSLRHIFAITENTLFLGIGFAILLQFVDPYLYPYYEKLGIRIPDDSDYVTFFATISGIGGVFIGLYYAGISAVGSAIYAKIPNNVRDLLAQERFGNVYMRFLSFLTFLGLMLIALRISGQPRVYLAIPVIAVSAGIGIIAFVKLGQRAFYLFDPTALSYHIFDQLQHWLAMVEAGGFRWLDKSFQNHAHMRASATLNTLATLVDITAKETHLNGKPFIELSQKVLRFLIQYEYTKRSIPTDSAWFEQRYEHRDWYRTDASRVAIAHQTGTTLDPEITSNKEWVEDKVVTILRKCIEVNLKEERYTEVLGLFDYLDAYVKRLAQEGAVRRAFALLEVLRSTVLDQLATGASVDVAKHEVLEKVAVAERMAALPISVALGYRQALEKVDRHDIECRVLSVSWANKSSIYCHAFPAYCLARLEWLNPRLAFEEAVEGRQVTPLWYRTELICQIEAEQFSDNTMSMISTGASFYRDFISKATSQKRSWLAAAIMSREWEYWHKVEDQLDVWQEKWVNLSNDRRIEGLPWSQFEVETLRASSTRRQEELLKQMSEQNVLLALLPPPDGFPDYAGQFLHTSGEVAFEALLTNNLDLLKSVFAPYLWGCVVRFDSLRPKAGATDWRAQQEFKVAAAALCDLMDISGFARLLADYHANDSLWNEVTATWDTYLADRGDQSPTLILSAAVVLTDAALEIPHRGLLRTSWHQQINQRLADVPRHEEYFAGSFGSHTVIDHQSPLVRIFADEPYGTSSDGIDIFIAYYLRNVNGAKDLDFGWRRRNLEESISREDRRSTRNAKEESAKQ